MKKITTIALLCTCYVLISSCTKEVLTETLYTPLANTKASSSSTFNDGPMMIGQRLDNPYNVNNMRAAYDSLVKSGEPINVHINNAPLIENIAINSKSFSEVKTKLLQKITDGSLKNVSTSSINTLFESYE